MNSAYEAAQTGAVWRDMSHFGRVRVMGRDAGALLHHLSTNHIKRLRPGQSCDAALVSSKARVLDWLSIARDADGFTVISSPNRREIFVPHARGFIGFRQDVTLHDATGEGALYAVFGAELPPQIEPQAREAGLNIVPTQRMPGGGVWLWSADAARVRDFVQSLQLPPCDPQTFNVLRVEAGVPVAGAELTDEINPWEARLDSAISLDKGCYNGQEIIARLNTYQKVKQRLCGLRLDAPLELAPGARLELFPAGEEAKRAAGLLTSAVVSPRLGPIALGFVRGEGEAGRALQFTNGTTAGRATVSALPFGASGHTVPHDAPTS